MPRCFSSMVFFFSKPHGCDVQSPPARRFLQERVSMERQPSVDGRRASCEHKQPPREQISIQALSLLMSRSQKKMRSDCISPEQVIFSRFFSLASLPSTKAECLGLLGSEANSSITGRKQQNTQQPRQYKPTYQPIPASPGLT